jgi:ABC-type transport system involved in cytochrome c biogenesis permease subunit
MRLALGYGSLAAYAASFGCYTWFLYDTRKWIGRAATLCLAAGIALHYFALLERSRWAHTVPYDDLYGSMSLFAWLLAVTYLALESIHRQRAVGAFLVAFLLLWLAPTLLAMPATAPLPPPARGPLFALHVTIEILAYAAFALSFICSLIYLVQNRVLRARSQGRVFWRFPALDVLERMSRSSVWVGVGALIFGSMLGFVWERRISGGYGGHDPKVMITAAILALYCGYLWLAHRSGWRGARAARLCAANFLIVLFSYTFVNFYLTAFHRYF